MPASDEQLRAWAATMARASTHCVTDLQLQVAAKQAAVEMHRSIATEVVFTWTGLGVYAIDGQPLTTAATGMSLAFFTLAAHAARIEPLRCADLPATGRALLNRLGRAAAAVEPMSPGLAAAIGAIGVRAGRLAVRGGRLPIRIVCRSPMLVAAVRVEVAREGAGAAPGAPFACRQLPAPLPA